LFFILFIVAVPFFWRGLIAKGYLRNGLLLLKAPIKTLSVIRFYIYIASKNKMQLKNPINNKTDRDIVVCR